MAASKWIEATTKEQMGGKRKKGSFSNLGREHSEPDADERGGPSDNDADDVKRKKKKSPMPY